MKKKILLLGSDGYIGWALLQRLIEEEHEIHCVDNRFRDKTVRLEMESFSATPNPSISQKYIWLEGFKNVSWYEFDCVKNISGLKQLFKKEKFDTIVNLAHQPSGPYSQKSLETSKFTLCNNILGANQILWLMKEYCPNAHYITIGSTGEYSHNLDIPIEEGYFNIEGASDKSIFPRRTNSIYHASKIANTYITDTLSRMWGLKTTDIMQAVVFGAYTNEIEKSKMYTRLDTDAAFGTVCNKFMVQAILGMDLTVYGWGEHKRGFIALNDSIQALMIAINNDSNKDFPSDYSPRVWNQLSFWTSMNDLAYTVKRIAMKEFNINVGVEHIENPRHEITEAPKHYSYKTDILDSYGYKPTRTLEEELIYTMKILHTYRDRLEGLRNNFTNHIRFK